MTLKIEHTDLTESQLNDVVLFLRRELELNIPGLRVTVVDSPSETPHTTGR